MKNKLIRLAATLCVALIACTFMPMLMQANAASTQRTVVKVGLPLQRGLAQQDAKGNLSGYTYDYLQEIAQFTGWEYEYKVIDGMNNNALIDMMDMLEKGEIDLMGGMLISDELAKIYRYSNADYLSRYDGLYVPNDSTRINELNYSKLAPLRVTVLGKASQAVGRLDKFSQDSRINIEKVPCETVKEQQEKVKAGEADAMWTINIGSPSDMHPVAKAYSQPAYFAFAPQKVELAREMDAAMIKLSKTSPQLRAKLEKKYLESDTTAFNMTNEERAYVNSAEPVMVMSYNYNTPGIWHDKASDTYKGIAVEILSIVSEKTGLEFNYEMMSDKESFRQALDSGECDIIAQSRYDYALARDGDFILSRPYASTAIEAVTRADGDKLDADNNLTALPEGLIFVSDNDDDNENKVYYQSMKECLDAVRDGKVRYAVGSNYDVQFNLNTGSYDMLKMVRQEGNIEICFGISKQADVNLLSIINKAIYSIPQEELNNMVSANMNSGAYAKDEKIELEASTKQQRMILALVILAMALTVIVSLISAYKARRLAASTKCRYTSLCEAAGEYVICFDFAKKKLSMSDNAARDFKRDKMMEIFSAREKKHGLGAPQNNVKAGISGDCEVCVQMVNGVNGWFRYHRYAEFNKRGKEIWSMIKFVNITTEKRERELLKKNSQEDALTGLENAGNIRKTVQNWLDTEIGKCAMVLADIDNFKSFNEKHGHLRGDYALIQLAQAISSLVPDTAFVSRYAGDVFMIFVPKADKSKLQEMCEGIVAAGKEVLINSEQMPINISIGVANANMAHSFDEMYEQAIKLVREIKIDGGANVKTAEI